MYRLGLEEILGFRKRGSTLRIEPVIPPEWDGFEIQYRCNKTDYRIAVRNPKHISSGEQQMVVVGVQANEVHLVDDGQEHAVTVTMG